MSEVHLVCEGATCKCQFGTAPDTLKVKTQTKRFINDTKGKSKLTATHKDIGQTFEKKTFGSCAKMNNNPCKPAITKWENLHDKVTLKDNNGKPLLENSKATCAVAGSACVEIINHGQITEVTQQNIQNSNAQIIKAINPALSLNIEDTGLLQIPNM
ncbi:DUF4280 domain-containing protein [Flavobacterium hibernum]|uniref:DUF4280 domain-containing protein n=1 Tax=Flavobacterium hibernum TaxID=37752 RepID=A0A0D0EE71_9FLAO|nr:DUF4280 domain-containing protein [Flavobacterium hibernum]KIO51844.1 hypothetical protein IW18_16480 [Flavobacterium hibernum]OXA84280.1 hypothetical protein B0A73_20600 [Flavobacterium hibernum]STO18980.1 Predicted chitinase [Flavobacterium hibernum]